MFERFTERARQVVVLAQEEARSKRHDAIDTPHILLGLIREREGLAARVLYEMGCTEDSMRYALLEEVGLPLRDPIPTTQQIPHTERAKKALELALREALSLGHNYIGTEHILLGVLRERDEIVTKMLREHGDDEIRNKILAKLGSQQRTPPVKKHTAPPDQVRQQTLNETALALGIISLLRHYINLGLDRLERELTK